METALVLQLVAVIGQLILQYGVPSVQKMIAELGKETITDADIEALKALVKPPEEYFK